MDIASEYNKEGRERRPKGIAVSQAKAGNKDAISSMYNVAAQAFFWYNKKQKDAPSIENGMEWNGMEWHDKRFAASLHLECNICMKITLLAIRRAHHRGILP